MTTQEAAEKLNQLAKLIAESTPNITQGAALTAKALIQERIQETGHDANEVQLTPYSEEYKKVRQRISRQTGFVDLTITGDMWRKTGIKSTGQSSKGYEVIIGGLDSLTEKKIEGNSFGPSFRGDILRVSKKEEVSLQENIDNSLNKIIKQVGL